MVRSFGILTSLIIFLTAAAAVATAQYADVLTIVTPSGGLRTHERTHISVESPSLALDTALIVWTLDGKDIERGIGNVDTTITLTDILPHELSVTVTEQGGVTRTQTNTLKATDIDLLWEAETLAPPLYRGRLLPTTESTVRAEVLIHTGKDDSPKTHIYSWKVNGASLPTDSGIGKNYLRLPIPLFENSLLLSVSVRDIDGDFTGQTSVRITTHEPKIVFYEKKPLLGLWTNTALFGSTVTSAGVTVSAFPYFLSAQSPRDAALRYEWTLPDDTNQPEQNDTPANEVTLTTTEHFSVHVVQKNKLLQEAHATGSLPASHNDDRASVFEITE